jgi:NADH-quinone oxidoreductase subunit M
MQMVAHGISTGALFIIAGQLYERLHTRDLGRMGGLWESLPAMGSMGMIFTMASLGLPGMGNFVAEFLTLAGTFKVSVLFASLASLGLIAATIYSLRIVQKVFLGKKNTDQTLKDLSVRESFILGALVVAIFFTGLYPRPVLNAAKPAFQKILRMDKQSFNDADDHSGKAGIYQYKMNDLSHMEVKR